MSNSLESRPEAGAMAAAAADPNPDLCQSCGLSMTECTERGIASLEAQEAQEQDPNWRTLRRHPDRLWSVAFERGYLTARAKFAGVARPAPAVPEEVQRLSEAATQGKWFTESEKCDGSYGSREGYLAYRIVTDAVLHYGKSGVIAETSNSTIGEIHEEHDEYGTTAWDDVAKNNTDFIAAAVNFVRSLLATPPGRVAEGERGRLRNPAAVYQDMLTGKIAKPAIDYVIRLYGADVLRSELADWGPPTDYPAVAQGRAQWGRHTGHDSEGTSALLEQIALHLAARPVPAADSRAVPDEALRKIAAQIGEAADDRFADWQIDRVVPVLREALCGPPSVAASPAAPTSEDDGGETCFVCGEPLLEGQLVYRTEEEGPIHAACVGPERENYLNADGDPLGPDDPIPQGVPVKPIAASAVASGGALLRVETEVFDEEVRTRFITNDELNFDDRVYAVGRALIALQAEYIDLMKGNTGEPISPSPTTSLQTSPDPAPVPDAKEK